jgi:hypothetical protein
MTVTVAVTVDGVIYREHSYSFIHFPSFSEQHFQRDEVVFAAFPKFCEQSRNIGRNSRIRRPWRGTSYSGSSVSLLWLRFLESLFIRCDACRISKLNYTFLWQYSELKHPLSAKSKQP